MGKGDSQSRRRGRPPVNAQAMAARQARVIDAAGKLLAERASSDITVEQLVRAAGTSRPTFYRWFPQGIVEVIDKVIALANEDLMGRILMVIAKEGGAQQRIEAGLRAYFAWCQDLGPVVYGIYREGFDEKSPAWRYRQQTLSAVIGIFRQQAHTLGLDHVSDLSIETLVSWIESAGAMLFRRYPVDPKDIEEQRRLTTEMFLAMLEVVRADSAQKKVPDT